MTLFKSTSLCEITKEKCRHRRGAVWTLGMPIFIGRWNNKEGAKETKEWPETEEEN